MRLAATSPHESVVETRTQPVSQSVNDSVQPQASDARSAYTLAMMKKQLHHLFAELVTHI